MDKDIKAAKEYAKYESHIFGDEVITTCFSDLEAFIAGAEWQSKRSPWISVEERLPMDYKPKLIRLRDGEVRLAAWDLSDSDNLHFWNDIYAYEAFSPREVTHWLEIPELQDY